MASVNFQKCKGSASASPAALIRHSDTGERLRHDHANKDIDKSRTPENENLTGRTYREALRYLNDRVKDLDQNGNRNKRRDRVVCFALEMPVPDGIDGHEDQERFMERALGIMRGSYGEANLVAAYTHYDEVHEYLDGGRVRTSRPHLHAFFVPEIGGQLNGKSFSSASSMRRINRAIDAMSREEFGRPFMTGEKARKRSVEDLKRASAEELEKGLREAQRLDRERLEAETRRAAAENEAIEAEKKKAAAAMELDRIGGKIRDAESFQEKHEDRGLLGRKLGTVTVPINEYKDLYETATAVRSARAAQEAADRDRQELEASRAKLLEDRRQLERDRADVENREKNLAAIIADAIGQAIKKEWKILKEFIRKMFGQRAASLFQQFEQFHAEYIAEEQRAEERERYLRETQHISIDDRFDLAHEERHDRHHEHEHHHVKSLTGADHTDD